MPVLKATMGPFSNWIANDGSTLLPSEIRLDIRYWMESGPRPAMSKSRNWPSRYGPRLIRYLRSCPVMLTSLTQASLLALVGGETGGVGAGWTTGGVARREGAWGGFA